MSTEYHHDGALTAQLCSPAMAMPQPGTTVAPRAGAWSAGMSCVACLNSMPFYDKTSCALVGLCYDIRKDKQHCFQNCIGNCPVQYKPTATLDCIFRTGNYEFINN